MVKIGQFEVKSNLLYWDSYTWVERISDTEAYIGLTDYGQQTLKDITAINPPSEGQRFVGDSDMMTIESISRDYIMKSPASMVILEVNMDIINSPDILNEDPFNNWILRVEVLDLGDLDMLIDGEMMADQILEEVGAEARINDEENDLDDDDFDYEKEFSIDSSNDYYEDEEDDYW